MFYISDVQIVARGPVVAPEMILFGPEVKNGKKSGQQNEKQLMIPNM